MIDYEEVMFLCPSVAIIKTLRSEELFITFNMNESELTVSNYAEVEIELEPEDLVIMTQI